MLFTSSDLGVRYYLNGTVDRNHFIKGAIVTLDDRKSKLRLAFPLPGKKAMHVKNAMLMLFKPIQAFVKTITFDNGKEFTLHET